MKVTKTQLKEIIKEEMEVVLASEEQELEEAQLPGLAYFLRSYRWINIIFKILVKAPWIPNEAKTVIQPLADASQSFVDAMETLYNEHPNLYRVVMGPIMAADVAGTATGKAKEVVLQQIYDNIQSDESQQGTEEQ